jgi:ABC-type lipoprotein release transport system permease subunit
LHGGPVFLLPGLGANEALVLGAALTLSLVAAAAPALIAYRTRPAIVLRGL